MFFRKAFAKTDKTKKEEARPQTLQQPLQKAVLIAPQVQDQRLVSFVDLMGNSDEEESKTVSVKSQSDLLSEINSEQHKRPARVNNRIGTVLPDAFLGDVLSRRENEIGDIDHDLYFKTQRANTIQQSNPSQQDFMDSFFAQPNQSQLPMPQTQIHKSASSHNSFEIIGDDHTATYVADITSLKAGQAKKLSINIEDQQDTKKFDKQDLILQKQSTPVNDTTNSSELVKSDQNAQKSQEIGSSSSQSNKKKSSEFVSPYDSHNNSAELLQGTSSDNSSDIQRSESLPTVIYSDFENRPTAQFVKQQDFIIETKQLIVEKEPDEFVPKVYLPKNTYESWKFHQPEAIQLEMIIDEQVKDDFKVELIQLYEQEIVVQTTDVIPQFEVAFEETSELDNQSQQIQESLVSSYTESVLNDSYFDRKRIYESSINEGSYSVAPVVQRRVAIADPSRTSTQIQTIRFDQEVQADISLVSELVSEVKDRQVQMLEEMMKNGVVELQPQVNRPVSALLPVPQMPNELKEGFLIQKVAEPGRQAIKKPKKNKNLLDQMRVAESEAKEQNSSEEFLTDKSFTECPSLNSEEIEFALQLQEQRAVLESQYFLDDLANFHDNVQPEQKPKDVSARDEDRADFLKVISENENAYKVYAESKFHNLRQQNQQFPTKNDSALQKVVSDPESFPGGVNKILGPTEKKTCIAVQDNYLLFGTSAGVLYAFNKETGILVGQHKEDGKEFLDNPITCIDVHLHRCKYVLLGFQKGQIALVDLNEIKKTVKLVKDPHKKPIVSVKFCDWAKEKPHYSMGKDHKCNECQDVKAWMFVSVDTEGKAVLNTVTNISFGLLYANDFVLNDPAKYPEHWQFEGLASKFYSKKYSNDAHNDNATLIAMACSESVVIRVLNEKSQDQRLVIEKPMRYPSENLAGIAPVNSRLPCLSWGYGKTPFFNFQVFPLLAIAWGPLIQIVVFRDVHGDNQTSEDFQIDGYYIMAQSISHQSDQALDINIVSLSFIEESLLIATTSNGEIRVMYTEKFKDTQFIPPQHLQQINMETIDSRCKYMLNGAALSPKQIEVEMERVTILQHAIEPSKYGIDSAHTVQVWHDKLFYLASNQCIYQLQHLNWLDNLLSLNQIAGSSSWINVFTRALKIYTGKLKGLRIEGDSEQQRKENMRTSLKAFIETLVSQTIAQFRVSASSLSNVSQTETSVAQNQTTLIRAAIEFSIEIGEPTFLFEALQDQFKRAGLLNEFAVEIKPYLLAGTFSECIIKENVLQTGVLGNPDPLDIPAENFEKIILNLRFDACSKPFLKTYIALCHDYGYSNGLIHLCLQCYGDQGALHALAELRDFYLTAVKRESEQKDYIPPTLDEVYEINSLSLTSQDRVMIERSSVYIGLKLLWTTRSFLIGKKVPRGLFTNNQQHILLHDVLDLITQADMIEIFMQIDAAAYFQIVSIAFNNPSTQFTFVQQGRPIQKTPYDSLKKRSESMQNDENEGPQEMKHNKIVDRVSSYFQERNVSSIIGMETSSTRLHYLCFIASIAGSFEQDQTDQIDAKLYFEVALELLKQSEKLIGYNKNMLHRRMTNKLMYRRLSKAGNVAPDNEKHLVLTEEMFVLIVQRAKPVLSDQAKLDEMLLAVKQTDFLDVKLILYDMNNDYLNCLKLFMQNKDGSQKPKLTVKTNKGEIDGFEWIENRYTSLDMRAQEDSVASQQLENFKREIFSQAFYLVKVNTAKTIKLCEAIFKSAHLEVIEKMQGEQQWQLVYIQHLIELKREDIKKLVSGHTPNQRNTGDFQKWKAILGLHVKLICIIEPSRVTPEIEKIVKDNFYPMEECLKTCVEFKQLEACAMINRKLGHYSESIELYLRVLSNGLNIETLKKELFYYSKDRQKHVERERERLTQENQARLSKDIRQTDNMKLVKLLIQNAVKTAVQIQKNDKLQDHYAAWVSKFGKNLELMDRVLDRISSICRNHPKEVLEGSSNESCVHVLQALFSVLFHPSMRRKAYCKRHIKVQIVSFCRSILEYISFNRLLQAATINTKQLKYKAIKELVNEVFCDKSKEIEMCLTIDSNAQSDLRFYQGIAILDHGTGVSFIHDSLTCRLCELSIHEQKFKSQLVLHSKQEDIVIFDCTNSKQEKHACHARCLRKLIQEEQGEGLKKAQLSERAVQKLYRCPTCNPKNQFVLANADKQQQEAIEVDAGGILDALDDQEEATVPNSRRTLRLKPATADQKMLNRLKQMRKFEETQMMDECLTRGDFKLD